MRLDRLSVHTKILAALALVFVSLMIATTWHMAVSERAIAQSLAAQKAPDTASSFFDGVNTMMLSVTMAQRELLRQKVSSNEQVTETRIIRGAAVSGVFGGGNPEQVARDELDRRALDGEQIIQPGRDANGRTVTVLTPILATSDFRGTNCLTCDVVDEGSLLVATRVTYPLAALDARIGRNILVGGVINVLMLVVGILVMAWPLRHIVTKPLTRMRDAVAVMARAKHSAEQRREQVESADSGLNLIAERVSHIREPNACMATAADEQSGVTESVGRKVVNIRQLADRTATDAEQTTSVSNQLLGLSEQLEQLVKRFRF